MHADNFLSFAPAPHDFHLQELTPNLTVVVGPNGAGKSSIFRVVQAVLDALAVRSPGRESVLPDPATLFHRKAGSSAPIRLKLDVVFDRDDEQETICALWQNALLYPNSTGFQAFLSIDQGDGTQKGNLVDPKRFSFYEQWVQETVGREELAPLFDGTLVLAIDPQAPHSTSLSFVCGGSEVPLAIGLYGFTSSAGAVSFPTLAAPTGQTSLAVAVAHSLPADVELQLAKFFHGQDVNFPEMPAMSIARLASYNQRFPQWFDTGLEQNRSGSLPPMRIHLNQLLSRDAHNVERVDLADVLGHLIRRALICVNSFSIHLEDDLGAGAAFSNAELLSSGHLALYLFRLKNGPEDDRELFRKISQTYHQLTHTSLDVEMKVVPKKTIYHGISKQEEIPDKNSVSLTTDNDIQLQFSGTGREQAAFLSALVHQHAGKVLLLDEPDAHLHPSLQQEITEQFASEGRPGQFLVITHSPYMVPPGGLERVRRIYMIPGERRSIASRRFSDDDIVELNLRKRAKEPDETMFLFSKATVFVEGANDAAALPVWFDQWAEELAEPSGEGQRLGIRFHAVGGKAGIVPMMRVADAFGVPCIAMYDADVLHPAPHKKKRKKPRDREKLKNDNETVLNQWRDYQLIVPGTRVTLGDKTAISLFPRCARGRIFLCGKTFEDDLEQLSVFLEHEEEAIQEVGGGPLTFRFIAKKYGCPEDYADFFKTLFIAAKSLLQP